MEANKIIAQAENGYQQLTEILKSPAFHTQIFIIIASLLISCLAVYALRGLFRDKPSTTSDKIIKIDLIKSFLKPSVINFHFCLF